MTSKVTLYGKHPLTLRVEPELYAKLRMTAAEKNLSVQELIIEIVNRYYKKK